MTPDTETLIDQAINLIERQHLNTVMIQPIHRYDLELDEDTHWGLVKLGAELKMHAETYAEEILKAHVESQLGKQTTNSSN